MLVNVRVERKVDLQDGPGRRRGDVAVESRLAGNGRLLVRYSGTEPLLRVMIEGRDQNEIGAVAAGDRGRGQAASRGTGVRIVIRRRKS